ncbi:hypothetical protein R3P38DRAFT_3206451 [Favolaschia claudopus]|uniref:Uncharacterized protein n=1 Tax=Favolaschia claudopus TaxID=2862362 RepID=A0AAW0AMZ2_9AGAR
MTAFALPLITPRLNYSRIQQLVTSRNLCELDSQGTRSRDPAEVLQKKKDELLVDREGVAHSAGYKSPPGQPGRPNSGGYNLERTLLEECAWTKDKFDTVQNQVRRLANKNLNPRVCYQMQNPDEVKKLCKQISVIHGLDGYEKFWPIKAMLKLHLKASSEAYRKEHMLNKPRPRYNAGSTSEEELGDRQ